MKWLKFKNQVPDIYILFVIIITELVLDVKKLDVI